MKLYRLILLCGILICNNAIAQERCDIPPLQQSADGITISNVVINEKSNSVFLAPNTKFRVSLQYTIYDCSCPNCIDQILVGFFHQDNPHCIYNGTPKCDGDTGNATIEFVTPSMHGTYFLVFKRSQNYDCEDVWWEYTRPDFHSSFIASIIVGSPVAPTIIAHNVKNISASFATIEGIVNANNFSSTAAVLFGTLPNIYTDTVSILPCPILGNKNITVTANLTGLQQRLKYFYKLMITNVGGTISSKEASFTTNTESILHHTIEHSIRDSSENKQFKLSDEPTTNTIPIISRLEPGAASNESPIVIHGKNFHPFPDSNIVYFGIVRGTILSASKESLRVQVPFGAMYAPVAVSVRGYTAYSHTLFYPLANEHWQFEPSSFDAQSFLPIDSVPYGIAVGDVNNDGKIDCAVSYRFEKHITIFINQSSTGNASATQFSRRFDIPIDAPASNISIADINSDGMLDILVTHLWFNAAKEENRITLVQNIGSNNSFFDVHSFATPITIPLAAGTTSVVVSDVNVDGMPYIIAGSVLRNVITILQNIHRAGTLSASSFSIPIEVVTGFEYGNVVVCDIDNDARPELIVPNQNENTFVIFQNVSIGSVLTGASFFRKYNKSTREKPIYVLCADFDNDGWNDIAVFNEIAKSVQVFRNESKSGLSFSDFCSTSLSAIPEAPMVYDIDGDGKLDILFPTWQQTPDIHLSYNISVLHNITKPGLLWFAEKSIIKNKFGRTSIAIADCDNDGLVDILGIENSSATLYVLHNTGPARTNWMFIGFLILILFAGVGGIGWFVAHRRLMRRVKLLEAEQQLLHERERISHDLHDEVGSALTKIVILSELGLSKSDDATKEELQRIRQSSAEIVNTMREIIWAVNPKNDTLRNFAEYLREYVGDYFESTPIEITFCYHENFPDVPLTGEFRRSFFLVLKEAVHNIVKHSHATKVSVSIALHGNEMEMWIEDNGAGIPNEIRFKFTNGIESMRKRIKTIGGLLTIETAEGMGTRVIARVNIA